MPEISMDDVRQFLKPLEGREITLPAIRKEFNITSEDKSWDALRVIMYRLAEEATVRPSGKKDGVYKVIRKALPVPVFSVQRERRPPFDLIFPRDRDNGIELPIAGKVIIREGDLILISGVSNYGKTTMSMNFLGENIDLKPILMGNEFTSLVENEYKPTPRFEARLEAMDWVEWVNGDNQDKFTLLPVFEDFAENVVKDRINIADWINLESGEHFLIGNVLNGIKKAIGKGIAIVVLQKSEYAEAGRGGQFTKDFADLELLIDRHGSLESRLTVGKCKESTERLTGRSWSFQIRNHGVNICDVKEVQKCWECHGKGYSRAGECPNCRGVGWVEMKNQPAY